MVGMLKFEVLLKREKGRAGVTKICLHMSPENFRLWTLKQSTYTAGVKASDSIV